MGKMVRALFKGIALAVIAIFSTSLVAMVAFIPKKRPPQVVVVSLSPEQIFVNKNERESELFEFFCEKRFKLNIKDESYLLVECRKFRLPKISKRMLLTRDVSLFILTRVLKRREALNAIKLGYLSLFTQDVSKFQNFESLKLLKKVFFSFSWLSFNSAKMKDVHIICSNSSITLMHESTFPQPRNYLTTMFWYSTNDFQFSKLISNNSKSDLSFLNELIDKHFVWNEFQRIDLFERGIIDTDIVGSILFRQSRDFIEREIPLNRVLYFDVTPQDLESSFYTTTMALKNINDLIEISEKVSKLLDTKILISLKPKRKYFKKHSRVYIEYLDYLERLDKLEILDLSKNIYNEVKNSKLVVAMPFTSPALVALELDIPSIYYCGLDEGWILGKEHYGCEVLRSPSELESKLIEIFRK